MSGNNAEFLERIKTKKWPIYKRTNNRLNIKKGDRVLFYLAGSHRRKIVADAILGSNLKENDSGFTINLSKIHLWKKQVLIKPFVESLEFIKNKEKWGVFMQGGIVKISDKDFETLVNK